MLEEPAQTMPVLEVHILALSPHTHVVDKLCAAVSSVGEHIYLDSAVHRQDLSGVHTVLVMSELNHRFEPPSSE